MGHGVPERVPNRDKRCGVGQRARPVAQNATKDGPPVMSLFSRVKFIPFWRDGYAEGGAFLP